jgi:hypothetical protein
MLHAALIILDINVFFVECIRMRPKSPLDPFLSTDRVVDVPVLKDRAGQIPAQTV